MRYNTLIKVCKAPYNILISALYKLYLLLLLLLYYYYYYYYIRHSDNTILNIIQLVTLFFHFDEFGSYL